MRLLNLFKLCFWVCHDLRNVETNPTSFIFFFSYSSLLFIIPGNQKLAALGIRVAHWITYHGLALNVTTDLSPFKWVIPCGIRDRQVGSIKGLLKEAQSCIAHGTSVLHDLDDTSLIHITYRSLIEEFSRAFQLEYHYKTISVPVLCKRKPSCFSKETQQSWICLMQHGSPLVPWLLYTIMHQNTNCLQKIASW